MIRPCVAMLFACVVSNPAWACSPPPPRDTAGFARHHVARLPGNALGVIFIPASGTVKPHHFRVTSAEDKRPLVLRVRTVKDRAWVRLELVHGFQARASYTFRYLPSHGNWEYPDHVKVSVDDSAVATHGHYAIAPAPRPRHRVIIAPTSAGSCVASYPAVVREFGYTTPPSLARYRDALDFDTRSSIVGSGSDPFPTGDFADMQPALYVDAGYSLGLGFAQSYTASKNAVVAPCGKRWPRVRISSVASFPEVDDRTYPMPPIELDLNSDIEGRCSPLDALVQTIDRLAPEPGLRKACRSFDDAPLPGITLDEWESRLGGFYGMSPTCHLVALAYLWRTGQFSTSPATMSKLGNALDRAMGWSEPPAKEAAIHALAFLVDDLPPQSRSRMARDLLLPLQATLVETLAAPRPPRPDDIARLVRASGRLPSGLHQQLRMLARGSTHGARAARAILAQERDGLRPK